MNANRKSRVAEKSLPRVQRLRQRRYHHVQVYGDQPIYLLATLEVAHRTPPAQN
jgi:hypothetical protein